MNDPTFLVLPMESVESKNLVSLLFCCFRINSDFLFLSSLVESYLAKYFGGTVQFHLPSCGGNIIFKGCYLSFWLLNFLTHTSNLQEAFFSDGFATFNKYKFSVLWFHSHSLALCT